MNSKSRQSLIVRTSALGIAVNLFFAAVKIVIGLAASSLAIVSEGMNNAADAASSLLALVGTKLSAKNPDEKHPFGYGRIEYLTSLVIAALILYTGVEMLKSSVDGILHPSEMSVSLVMIGIVAFTAAGKFILGIYTIRTGKKVDSAALVAVGEESRNDSIFSIVTILVTLIYMYGHVSLDAYAGLLFSLIILKSAGGTLKETIDELLGRPGQEELAKQLYKEIRRTPGIINAADMMLHNYGPGAWSGSVNIEIDHSKTIGEVYQYVHDLQLRIMHEYQVTMVFGMYAVDNDSERGRELRRTIAQFVKAQEHVKSFHAVYIEPETEKIYCDLIVDYKLADWEALRTEFVSYLGQSYPGSEIELTIETEYV